MAMKSGFCKRSLDTGERIHELVDREDGDGRRFQVCKNCGSFQVKFPTKAKDGTSK